MKRKSSKKSSTKKFYKKVLQKSSTKKFYKKKFYKKSYHLSIDDDDQREYECHDTGIDDIN